MFIAEKTLHWNSLEPSKGVKLCDLKRKFATFTCKLSNERAKMKAKDILEWLTKSYYFGNSNDFL